ncbi:MAG: hypothetical protein JWQ74_1700 [Marmoricola sp.]|nr:hypothetical protein [Marmoricola sp.]
MFYAAVGLFMVVLPTGSVVVALADGGHGSTMAVVGTWFVFWAVGVRLFTAGVRQVIKPGLTSEGILGIPGREAWLLVRELGFANIAIGSIGILSLWNAGWRPAAALAGGVFLLAAGALHLVKKHRETEENVAMVSDLAIGLLMLAYVLTRW